MPTGWWQVTKDDCGRWRIELHTARGSRGFDVRIRYGYPGLTAALAACRRWTVRLEVRCALAWVYESTSSLPKRIIL